VELEALFGGGGGGDCDFLFWGRFWEVGCFWFGGLWVVVGVCFGGCCGGLFLGGRFECVCFMWGVFGGRGCATSGEVRGKVRSGSH